MALGVGAYQAGFFHLTTHAMFKACLFLCSGSIIHAMHHALNEIKDHETDPQNMYNMGAALIKNMGFQNVDDFLTDPDSVPPQPDPREQMEQAEMQLKQKELEIKAADIQVKQMKIQQDAAEAQVDAQLKVAELKLEAEQGRGVALG